MGANWPCWLTTSVRAGVPTVLGVTVAALLVGTKKTARASEHPPRSASNDAILAAGALPSGVARGIFRLVPGWG